MVELVDTPDLGSGIARYVGSSPILGNFSIALTNYSFLSYLSANPVHLVLPASQNLDTTISKMCKTR